LCIKLVIKTIFYHDARSEKHQNLKYVGNYMNHITKHLHIIHFTHTIDLCVPYHSWNKQRLFLDNNKWLDTCKTTQLGCVVWRDLFSSMFLFPRLRKKYDTFLRNHLKNRTSYQKINPEFPLLSYTSIRVTLLSFWTV
jgi:hypothetical protein